MITPEAQQKGAQANREKAIERDTVALNMRDGGATYAEIAERFGINHDSVRTLLLRARNRAGRPPMRGQA